MSEKPATMDSFVDTAATGNLAESLPADASSLPTSNSAIIPAQSAVDAEIERRKARAAKFGVPYVEPSVAIAKSQKPLASSKPLDKTASAPKPAEDPEVLARRRAKFGIPEPVEKDKKKNGVAVAQSASPVDP